MLVQLALEALKILGGKLNLVAFLLKAGLAFRGTSHLPQGHSVGHDNEFTPLFLSFIKEALVMLKDESKRRIAHPVCLLKDHAREGQMNSRAKSAVRNPRHATSRPEGDFVTGTREQSAFMGRVSKAKRIFELLIAGSFLAVQKTLLRLSAECLFPYVLFIVFSHRTLPC